MSTMPDFGAWLRERRNEMGVTQEELSERLGFSSALLRKLESGERRPSGQIAALLAAHFRIPDDEREAFIAFARTGRGASTGGQAAQGGKVSPLAPWRAIFVRRTNLPAVLTPIVGREREEDAVRELLLQHGTRLLTLTGTAGIGKTRLALQVASGLLDSFEDGVYFVDLAPVVEPSAVLEVTAHTLGLAEEDSVAAGSAQSVLLEHARERRMLLVLDNFEQVLDAAPSVVKLLHAGPWVKALVTSREALHVQGERRYPVPPLGVPDLEQLPQVEMLARYPSIELFLRRARDMSPDFDLTPGNAADVAAICAALEGLPLAIELAASRANHFSPADMRSALGSRLRLLVGGARDLPARQRTLRAAIEWSYRLLGPDEQRLFRHLGAFVGGFTRDAIEATYENPPGASGATADMLASLVDKSLVRRKEETGRAREARFGLLESVREYALEQMRELGEEEGIRGRHAEYYLSVADQAEQHFRGPQYAQWGAQQIEWIDALEADLDNMRAALDRYEEEAKRGGGSEALDDLEKGLRLAGDLRRIWFGRGYFAEGLQWLRAFLSMTPRPLPAERPGLRAAYGVALLVVGRLASSQEDIASARPLIEEALRIFTEAGDAQFAANTLLVLGSLAVAQGNYEEARSYQQSCLEIYRALGHNWGAGAALNDLGDIEVNEGNVAVALPLLEESLGLYRVVGEHFGAASVLESLGLVAYYQGDYAAARASWEESLQLRKETGARRGLSNSLVLLGQAVVRQGDYERARLLLKEGLLLARQLQVALNVHRALTGFGVLESLQDNPQRAAFLFGAAEALRQAEQLRLSAPHQASLDAEIAATRARLPGDAWDNAWAMGTSAALDEVVASLLAEESGKAQGAGRAAVP